MMEFAADENFDNDILRGLIRLYNNLEIIRIQDTEISGADDPIVLEWCAKHKLILLTHDRETMPGYFSERLKNGLDVPGVFIIKTQFPIGQLIGELALVIGASFPGEWDGKLRFIPMR